MFCRRVLSTVRLPMKLSMTPFSNTLSFSAVTMSLTLVESLILFSVTYWSFTEVRMSFKVVMKSRADSEASILLNFPVP